MIITFSSVDTGHYEPMRLIECHNQNRFSFVSDVIFSLSLNLDTDHLCQ